MQRRELFNFFSSTLKGEEANEKPLRPPYYKDAALFLSECVKCDTKCATVCPEKIIIMENNIPRLNFTKGGCTYCDECALACEFGVLKLEDKHEIKAHVTINQKRCLSWMGVMCFSCKDPCLEDAIEFHAMFMPTILTDKCTACGFCVGRCPADAIDVKGFG